jgi:hypothetical protein
LRIVSCEEPSAHDRALGVACLVVCPAISGVVFGLVATAATYASGHGDAVAVGALVGFVMFVANAFAICLTASSAYLRSVRRMRVPARRLAAHRAHAVGAPSSRLIVRRSS